MMNIRFAPLLLTLVVAASPAGRAQAPTPPAPSPPEFAVIISETLDRGAEGFATFAAIQKVYMRVLSERKWPVTVSVERFGAANDEHPYELRVFFKGIYYETPGALTLRAWVTLVDHGKEHDFGIIKTQLNQGPIEHRDDAFEVLLRREAETAASRIEPILFPGTGGAKH